MPLPRPAPGTARWWVIGGVGCLVGAAGAVWFALSATVGLPSWTDLGYRVANDSTVTVVYEVQRPDRRAVTCTVRALDNRFATVGTVVDHVPTSSATSVRRTVTIRTTARAVTGTVKDCTIDPSTR